MRFDEFLDKTGSTTQVSQSIPIDGSFSCQTCGESVDEAEYFQQEKILRWKCSESHISYIEDVRLF